MRARRWIRAAIALTLSVWVVLDGPLVFAQGDEEGLLARGVALRWQRRDAEALVEFQHAYAMHPCPRAGGQIALAEQALGHWPEAESGLVAALASADDPWIAYNRRPLEAALETVRQRLAESHDSGRESPEPSSAPGEAPTPESPLVPTPAPAPAPEPAADASAGWSRTAAYAALGAGAAAWATTGVLAAFILERKQVVSAHCPGQVCDDEGYAAASQGRTLSTAATVAFAAGAGVAGAGVYLLIARPGPPSPGGGARAPARLALELIPASGGALARLRGVF
jgi:hypothetical protein